jgi:general secretion pathway protein J
MAQNNFYSEKGFTLLEILFALFIFTIVSLILVKALHTVFESQAATDKSAARLSQLQLAILVMSRDIEQAIDRPVTLANGAAQGFIGLTNKIIFTHAGFTNPLDSIARSTLQRTAYFLDKDTLVRRTWSALDVTKYSKFSQRAILTDVQELNFLYLDDHGKFQHSWPPPEVNNALPRAVQISIKISHWGTIQLLFLIPGKPIVKPT